MQHCVEIISLVFGTQRVCYKLWQLATEQPPLAVVAAAVDFYQRHQLNCLTVPRPICSPATVRPLLQYYLENVV